MEKKLGEMAMNRALLTKQLTDLSPLSVLQRGYSITLKLPEKRVLKDTSGVEKGDRVQVLLSEGELGCRIEKVET
jgi:exodeoxyribonuclease VII large subunit